MRPVRLNFLILAVLTAAWALASGCDGAEDTPHDTHPDTSGADTSGADTSGADTSGADTADTSGADTSGSVSPCADPAACLDACSATFDLSGDRLAEVMTLYSATADADVWVRMARRVGDRSAVGETFPFDLVGFEVVRGGEVACAAGPGGLSYAFGHHNWDDTATATVGGLTYAVHIRFDFSGAQPVWSNTLTVTPEGGGAALIDGLPLTATACASSPPGDLNVCQQTRQP